MSYCVNCGVELERGIKSCPLCDTPVLNPHEADVEYVRRYPDLPVEGVKSNRRDLILPVTLLLLIPTTITLLSDYLTTGGLSWSVFVVSSLILVWIFLIPPFAMKKSRLLPCLALDWTGLAIYLYILSLATEEEDWLIPIALPVAGVLGVLVLGIAALFIYVDLRKLVKFAIVMFAGSAFLVFIELMIAAHDGKLGSFSWSFFPAIPIVIIGIIALVVNRNQRLKQDLKERLFY